MSTDGTPSDDAPLDPSATGSSPEGNGSAVGGRVIGIPIDRELQDAYLTYAMSVIISRALPDVRDGLKPSQRRILVAMNDLNLRPDRPRVKCAKISGDTSGNYHPHGESVIYPTLVRMAQEWNMRTVLVDKQGNFGSIAGLPPAAMRYTEARLSQAAAQMLENLDQDTVDFVPTYDERRTEPVVLPSKFPNLLVNGAQGIAVAMTTSIPPHNAVEICQALIRMIDQPEVSIDELLEIVPGPDFPTGGIIQGTTGIRRGYHTGGGTITVRARATIDETGKNPTIIITEIPYMQTRDRIVEKIGELIRDDRIKGVLGDNGLRDESSLEQPVRVVLELNPKLADPNVILNQLYQFSPLQDTFSLAFVALVDGKPRRLNFKELLQEFLRHRVSVIRRRTQFLLDKDRRRKHTVEGLLLAFANIDEIIRIIRDSTTQTEAKERLQGVPAPASMMQRALGEEGFAAFQEERGVAGEYFLTPVQADAILRMTLGQLVNLEQEKLGEEFRSLLESINEYLRILSDDTNIFQIIRDDLEELSRRYNDPRRTEIIAGEIGEVDIGDLITEETMVVTISQRGYIKRTPSSVYRSQRRGGKGLRGAKVEEEDPIEHLFVASTHDYLLFFTNQGKVHWKKVYDLPQKARDSKGVYITNILPLAEGERVASCLAIRDFNSPDHYLLMATRAGLVKKTDLVAYSRPKRGGIIAIKLREGDELVGVAVCSDQDEIVLATAGGMAIRFPTTDARPMGRASSGVKGINPTAGDTLVGMALADEAATLLTVCAKGYGKRTPFGSSSLAEEDQEPEETDSAQSDSAQADSAQADSAQADSAQADLAEEADDADEPADSSARRYRTQHRGGKGVRDIKPTPRNGPVIAALSVADDDEVLMITAQGKLQRIAVGEIRVLGRNTQGVRIMNVDGDDKLAAVVRVPRDVQDEAVEAAEEPTDPLPEDSDEDLPVAQRVPQQTATLPAAPGTADPEGPDETAQGQPEADD